MTNTITFKWNTGNIEIAACAVLDMTAAYLARLVKTATANADEVKTELSAFIQGEIDKLNPKRDYDKRTIEQYKKLLSVVAEKKQSKREKAVIRIAKNCSSAMAGKYYGVIHDDEKYCVLDGYRMVRYAAPIDGLEDAPCTFDTVKAIGNKSAYSAALALPTVQEIKADMKIAKLAGTDINHIRIIKTGKRLDGCYDFGYGLPMVNAKYLIDMIEALPEAIAYYNPEHALCNPIYFDGGEDDGILLPVRKMQEYAAPVEEKPIEKPVEAAAPVQSEAEKELEAERERRRCMAEQEQNTRENEIAAELAKAEQKIISSGYIENKNLYGKLLFLRLFDKYGVKVAIRSRGWIIDKLKSVNQHTDGSANISFRATRKGERASQGFWDAYVELRDILIKAKQEAEEVKSAAPVVDETVDTAAINRVVAVAIALNDGAHDMKAIVDYIHMYGNDMITEDEAKDALLRYTVPLALPAHEEAVQDTTAPETIQIAAVNVPAVLRHSARHYRRLQYNISSAKNLLEIFKIVCTSLNKYDRMNIPHYRRKTQCQPKPQSDSNVMMPRPP